MSFNSSWVPDKDPQTLFSERCWFQGLIISAIAYGVTLLLYFMTLRLIAFSQTRAPLKQRLPLLIYTILSFLLGTLFMVTAAGFTQMAFIDDRNYPGGPNGFELDMGGVPINVAANTAFVFTNWLSDALLVWRFKVIYQGCRFPTWAVMFLPCLTLAGSVGLGVVYLIQASTNYISTNVNFTLPYFSLSLALNIILTIAIALRLLHFRNRIASVLGKTYGSQYTSAAAMIVESAALYSALSVTFLVLFTIGNMLAQALFQSLSQFQSIATLLIVFRVVQGKGWSDETTTRVMTSRNLKSDLHLESGKMRSASSHASLTRMTSLGDTVHHTNERI